MSQDRSAVIFGNPMPASVVRAADKKKRGYVKKYGYDPEARYTFRAQDNPVLTPALGVKILGTGSDGEALQEAGGVVVGNIRMGFGHYRISMAIASCARARGLTPYWLDLLGLSETTAAKVIGHLNDLYSFGSRLSQRLEIFNRFYWEPLNYHGFKKLSFNATDQKVSELFGVVCQSLPPDMPFFGTHVWPAQAAIHGGMRNVINIVPDNWPMALHLAEGALHLVQSPSAYQGYRLLREMDAARPTLNPMPARDLRCVGHFVDHELVSNLEADCAARLSRIREGRPRRLLLSVGGAGAQQDFFAGLLRTILPLVKREKATLFLNFGDHRGMWDALGKQVPELPQVAQCHFDDWQDARQLAETAVTGEVSGVHAFANKDIFAAVYLSNLLMRATDVLITKPSELAFYPVPKLFIKRVGGHEQWGAIRGAELGDGTIECAQLPMASQMLELLIQEDDLLTLQVEQLLKLKAAGVYDGAYRAIDLALERQAAGHR